MAEEVTEIKLVEASKHFNNRNYAETLKVLASCPQEDVKVKHNTAVASYLAKGGNVNDVLAVLESVPAGLTGVDVNNKSSTTANNSPLDLVDEFLYDGQEGAHYNRAVLMLHNGFAEKAANVLRELAARPTGTISPEVQIRSALLLQVATAAMSKKKIRTRADDDLVASVLTAHIQLIQSNASIKKMFQLSNCENSTLHDWFKDSEKGASDRVTYYNNLGVLAMNEGKENLASVYFNNAMKHMGDAVEAASKNADNNDLVLHSVLYNAGVCALFRKEYSAAVKSLLLTQTSMKGSPLLWLRIAQAALGVHGSYNNAAVSTAYAEAQNNIAADIAKHGRLLPGFQLLQMPSTLSLYGSNTDTASRTALDTAMRAIDNGLGLLVPANTQLVVAADKLVLSGNTAMFRVLQYLLCYAAYIEIQRMNYGVAAAIATDLLSLGKGGHPLQPAVLITGVLYASEALCHLNKPAAALKVLQSVSAADFIITEGNMDEQKLRVAAVMINLVLVHIANGNWKTANTLTTNLISKYNATPAAPSAAPTTFSAAAAAAAANNFNQTATTGLVANQAGGSQWLQVGRCATLLQVFIELAQGNRDRALEILALQPVAPPLATL